MGLGNPQRGEQQAAECGMAGAGAPGIHPGSSGDTPGAGAPAASHGRGKHAASARGVCGGRAGGGHTGDTGASESDPGRVWGTGDGTWGLLLARQVLYRCALASQPDSCHAGGQAEPRGCHSLCKALPATGLRPRTSTRILFAVWPCEQPRGPIVHSLGSAEPGARVAMVSGVCCAHGVPGPQCHPGRTAGPRPASLLPGGSPLFPRGAVHGSPWGSARGRTQIPARSCQGLPELQVNKVSREVTSPALALAVGGSRNHSSGQ